MIFIFLNLVTFKMTLLHFYLTLCDNSQKLEICFLPVYFSTVFLKPIILGVLNNCSTSSLLCVLMRL